MTANPLEEKYKNESLWLFVVEDLTADLNAEQSRTWGMMAQRVSHDIKSPLTSMLLNAERLQQEIENKVPEHADHFDPMVSRIKERVEHLRNLSRNFLKFVDVDELKLVRADLGDVVKESTNRFNILLPADISLDINQEKAPIHVRVDEEQIYFVMENLLANAVDAMPSGGAIHISINKTDALHLIDGNIAQEYGIVEIRDTGKGIPQQNLAKVFDAGFSGTENGTGLGLAIVRKIINDHQGRIEVESEVDAGSVFTIYLPIVTDNEKGLS